MKRRHVIRSILSLPAITALPAAAQAPAPEKLPPRADDTPQLAMTSAEAVAAPAPAFFSREQFRTLERLCEVLVPAANPKPGAKQAGVAAFLDFLIGRSSRERQALYQHGLDRLIADSFADASPARVAELLAPLRAQWTYQRPADEFARFLVSAKEEVLRATMNSREWASSSTGRRGGSGVGPYWYSLD